MEELKVELEYLKARIEGVENLINVLHGPPPDELFLSGNLVSDDPKPVAHILARQILCVAICLVALKVVRSK